MEKQNAGKMKMRQFGKVEIPQETFIAALKMMGEMIVKRFKWAKRNSDEIATRLMDGASVA